MIIAHKAGDSLQSLEEHSDNVALIAQKLAAKFHAGDIAYIIGKLHDYGKNKPDFQLKITEKPSLQVDHSTVGAQKALALYKDIGFIMAYCIAGHHTGLPDGKSASDSCLINRLEKKEPKLAEIKIDATPVLPELKNPSGFTISLFIRMLFSSLADADFLDTEKFMDRERAENRPTPSTLLSLKPIFDKYISDMQKKAPKTEINKLRTEIYRMCESAADKDHRRFSLTVPTGGGKTLSSMAFAINYATANQLDKIIYVIPYTSIIEQTADTFRQIFGEENVLEHHSNFDGATAYNDNDGSLNYKMKLASENWDAPIVVTTSVQFFESFFSNRTSRCRKLHNVCNSVVIFDEAQMLPYDYLYPCIELLRTLSDDYNITTLLCTATQPVVNSEYLGRHKLNNVSEIISDTRYLYEKFKRVKIENIGLQTDENIISKIKDEKSSLTIVNTRKHAFKLYCDLQDTVNTFHLSTLMCPQHRRENLRKIKEMTAKDQPCTVISTQLIEAGVDVDFPTVFRSIAGVDSIAQSAGRCNRNGRLDAGYVYIFDPADAPAPRAFRQYIQTAQEILRHHDDILSRDAVREYFERLYKEKGNLLDAKKILPSLERDLNNLCFPFKETASKFRLIESATIPVIIRFNDEAEELIKDLMHAEFTGSILRKLQKFTVQIYEYEFQKIHDSLESVNGFFVADKRLYDKETGLIIFENIDNTEDYIL